MKEGVIRASSTHVNCVAVYSVQTRMKIVKEWEGRVRTDLEEVWANVMFATAMGSKQLGQQAWQAVSVARAVMQHRRVQEGVDGV